MAHTYLECDERFIVGSKPELGIIVWDETNPNNDISALTAVCSVFNSADAAVMTTQPCGITGTTLLTIQRFWDTTGLTPGKYRVDIDCTLGVNVQTFQFAVMIDPKPGPQ